MGKGIEMRNRREVEIDGMTFEVEASILAADVYADEFVGQLRKPYRGILEDDMLVTFNRSRATIPAYVKANKRGDPVRDRSGEYVLVEHGGVKVDVPNPEYRGIDAVALVRYLWAMGTAADSIAEPWEEFAERMEHADFAVREVARAFATIVYELGGGCIFRDPEGHRDAGEPDEGQQGDEQPADDGGEGVA